MSRALPVCTIAAVVLGCSGAATSSGQNDSTVFVVDVLAAPSVTSGQMCNFTDDPTQPSISTGTLDLALRDEYDPTYLLGNRIAPPANAAPGASDPYVLVGGVTVRVTDASGAPVGAFTRLAQATIDPPSGGAPGYAPVTATTIDASTLEGDATLQQSVAAGGTTRLRTYVSFLVGTSSARLQTDEFEFDVDVCRGCLIQFPAVETDPSQPEPNCLLAPVPGTTTAPCVLGQDSPVDCSLCQDVPACHGAAAGG